MPKTVIGYIFKGKQLYHFRCPFQLGSTHKGLFALEANSLTLLHSERPKLYRVLAILSAIGSRFDSVLRFIVQERKQDVINVVSLSKKKWQKNMDGWMILRPFQQCFSHIRMMGG